MVKANSNRRLPVVFAFHKKIHQIKEARQAIFVGFFGPIGVSAIFYLYISLEFLETLTIDGVEREDAEHLGEVMTVVIWFLVICSIVGSTMLLPTNFSLILLGRSWSLNTTWKGRILPSTNPLQGLYISSELLEPSILHHC